MLPSYHYAAEVVLALALLVFLATAILVVFVLLRRSQRQRHFAAVDRLRDELGSTLDAMLAGETEYRQGVTVLRQGRKRSQAHIFEALFEEKLIAAANIPVLRQLAVDLGFVGHWQRGLRGEFGPMPLRQALAEPGNRLARTPRLSFLLRAKSAEFLGTIRHRPSWPLLVQALDDPHPDVQSVAARSLGLLAEPASFGDLVERLQRSLVERTPAFSLRRLESAMARFPLEAAPELIPSLDHAHARVRFAAADIILKMIERPASRQLNFALKPALFPPALADPFLTRLVTDANADVRGRAALVISYLEDARVIPALVRLVTDSQWFVRLHAVRAFGHRRRLPEIAPVARRLTDIHWRVREAAVEVLARRGSAGRALLLDHFLATRDEYSQEQVAEQIERGGLVPALLERYGQPTARRESRAIERLIEIGKTSAIRRVLGNGWGAGGANELFASLRVNSDPKVQAFVEEYAKTLPTAARSPSASPLPEIV